MTFEANFHSAESDVKNPVGPLNQNWCIFRKSHKLVLDAFSPKKFDSAIYRSGEAKGEALECRVLGLQVKFS